MKKKIAASELIEAEVTWVSLVNKGANRLNFKVIKSENGETKMQGLKGLFGKEISESYIASIIVNKNADMDKAVKIISKAGFSIENKEENKDGLTIFHQEEVSSDTPNQYVFKTNKDIGIHVVCSKAFDPTDFETPSFKELFNKAGVLPNVFMAHDILKEVIMNILFSEHTEDSATAGKKIKKAINEFGSVVTGIIESIPVSAFKMEDPELLKEVQKELEKEKNDMKQLREKEEDSEEEKLAKAEAGEAAEEAEEAEGDTEEKLAKAEEGDKEDATLATIAKTLEAITGDIESLKESVEGLDSLKEELSKLENKVEEVSEVSKSNDEALNGTTNSEAQGDKSETRKAQPDPQTVLKDTAYGRVG